MKPTATGAVTLRREDGREFTLSPERLSEEDRARVNANAAVVREARKKAIEAVAKLLDKPIRYQTTTAEPQTYHVYYPPSYSPEKPACSPSPEATSSDRPTCWKRRCSG
ncbi:MAG: hypothetical protein NTV46_01505 [Verrucomicrobia bacterium]|nr:hypothetical protein [Verrucomicrobiota bacterium]